MFPVGLVLGFLGVVFHIMASPLLNWLTNESGFHYPVTGLVGGLFAVIQQGAFLGALFLLVGSFVVRSTEEAVAAVRNGRQLKLEAPRD